jgi:hypothetical protein
MLAKVGRPPKIDLCQIRVLPHKTKPGKLTVDLECVNQKRTMFYVPIHKADKYVCVMGNQFVDGVTYVGKVIEALKLDAIK